MVCLVVFLRRPSPGMTMIIIITMCLHFVWICNKKWYLIFKRRSRIFHTHSTTSWLIRFLHAKSLIFLRIQKKNCSKTPQAFMLPYLIKNLIHAGIIYVQMYIWWETFNPLVEVFVVIYLSTWFKTFEKNWMVIFMA